MLASSDSRRATSRVPSPSPNQVNHGSTSTGRAPPPSTTSADVASARSAAERTASATRASPLGSSSAATSARTRVGISTATGISGRAQPLREPAEGQVGERLRVHRLEAAAHLDLDREHIADLPERLVARALEPRHGGRIGADPLALVDDRDARAGDAGGPVPSCRRWPSATAP